MPGRLLRILLLLLSFSAHAAEAVNTGVSASTYLQAGLALVLIVGILFGTAWMTGYSAAKAAIINFSRAVSSEAAASNIRCNVVIPGVVATPATADMLNNEASRKNTEKLIPMRRIGAPVELANAVLFLASDEASYITGATLSVDGGRAADLITAIE